MRAVALALAALTALLAPAASAYPLYGSEATGIRRLEEARLATEGKIPGVKHPPGERLSVDEVRLRLLDRRDLDLPAPDPAFTREVVALLGADAPRYQFSILDLSDPAHPRYAEHRGHVLDNPGSVGKLVVVLAVFQALADAYPDDVAARLRVLRETRVVADDFIVSDHHTVRFWDPEKRALTRRRLRIGDTGNLYEWLDWMLSASSNAAAAEVMSQAMLMVQFGREYPVPAARAKAFFADTSRADLTALYARTFDRALERNGFDLAHVRQGSFFTRTGQRKVQGTGSSHATPRALARYLLRLEQGRLVDEFSSLEIKRLLYMTERRIRYASSPALRDAAVYFKSGSLYQCEPEPGFRCVQYKGNRRNLMNSVAIVESPARGTRWYYLVALMSNVLKRNSAVEHQTLATRIERLIEREDR